MSGVYFPNMQMPQTCFDCDMCYDNFYCKSLEVNFYSKSDKEHIPDGFDPANGILPCCTAIPVPDHGRRVVYRRDVYNAIEAKRIKTLEHVLSDQYINGMHDGLKQALFALATVEDAPTVIPADRKEERTVKWREWNTFEPLRSADKEDKE